MGATARVRVPAPARHGRAAARLVLKASTAPAAASTPRSARIATCWPIWCGGCWRTAPTRPSSTRSSTRPSRPRPSPPAPSPRWPRRAKPRPMPPRTRAVRARAANSRGLRPDRRSGTAPRSRPPRALPPRGHASTAAPIWPAEGRGRRDRSTGAQPGRPDDMWARCAQATRGADVEAALAAARPGTPRRRSARRRAATAPPTSTRPTSARSSRCSSREAGKTPPMRWRTARGGGFPALLRRPAGPSPDHAPARRLHLHLALELPAGDLHRPDRGALAAGNAVLAKPAEQTPLIAAAAVG
jgi:hypothetical protein